jgi:uncharacterized membrane protein YfcA
VGLDVWVFIIVGFLAQLVDGAVGMAYGLTASVVLVSSGVPPAVASASVHASEIFTSGASGLAHWRAGNINPRLLTRLAIAGAIGGASGAFALTSFPTRYIQLVVSLYMLIMGSRILWSAIRRKHSTANASPKPNSATLGFLGGLLDAIGGGGWGALVTTTLVERGIPPALCHWHRQRRRVFCHPRRYRCLCRHDWHHPLARCHGAHPRGPHSGSVCCCGGQAVQRSRFKDSGWGCG